VAAGAAFGRMPERLLHPHGTFLLIACTLAGFWITGPPGTTALTKEAPDAAAARAALRLIHPGDGVAAGTSFRVPRGRTGPAC